MFPRLLRARRRQAVHHLPALLSLLTALAALLLPVTSSAQSPRPTATLLKRLGEAVDGNRTGQPIFVVASHRFPNPVGGTATTRADAEAIARRLGADFDVFGPYDTELDSRRGLISCVHDGRFSVMDKAMYCPNWRGARSDIAGLALAIRLKSGTTETIPLPDGTDALFLGMPAIDKFVIPYYTRIVGAEQANRMRASFDSLGR